MTQIHEIRQANRRYAADKAVPPGLSAQPLRSLAVLTCMDCRLDAGQSLGLQLGEANVVRNAGGRASEDALRSLAVSTRLLGAKEIYVIQHLDCGMEAKTQEGIVRALAAQDPPAGAAAEQLDWLTIESQPGTLIADARRIKESPLIDNSVAVHGLIQDPTDGSLTEVITL